MKFTYFCLAASLILVGCATAKPIQGPNGGIAYFIKCGTARIDACYRQAAKVCPNGYTFADRQTTQATIAVPTATGGFMMVRGPNTMLVECNP